MILETVLSLVIIVNIYEVTFSQFYLLSSKMGQLFS